jgi:tRNA(adenine34) deaminase
MLAKTDGQPLDQAAIDVAMMRKCIALSSTALRHGELPFAAIICAGDQVIAEATNEVARSGDITRHAELLAISVAQKVLGHKDLSRCTIYSNVEPCPMCAFPMRETSISRVIFAITSPKMGGFSKWNILRDAGLAQAMPEVFGPAPEIITGLLWREAEKVWSSWNPLIWTIIKHRDCFGQQDGNECEHHPAMPPRGLVQRLIRLRQNYRSA